MDGAFKKLRADPSEHSAEITVEIDVLRPGLAAGRLTRGDHLQQRLDSRDH